LPARRRPHNSRDECRRRDSPFFGLPSEVDNGDNRAHGGAIAAIIQDELSPLLIGKDASRIERLRADMFALSIPNRDRKLVMEAIACVETALWDSSANRSARRSLAAQHACSARTKPV
jgi:hypothetical protein